MCIIHALRAGHIAGLAASRPWVGGKRGKTLSIAGSSTIPDKLQAEFPDNRFQSLMQLDAQVSG